jgi:hypothetical protein
MVAMVMGAWVFCHWRCGGLVLHKKDVDYVMNMYANCARVAGDDGTVALMVIGELFDAGLMPEGMQNPFAG